MGRLDAAAAVLAELTAAARGGELDRADAVAAVAEARVLATTIEAAELATIDAARAAGATWGELASAIGASGRQGAQKRRADLSRRAPGAAAPVRREVGDVIVTVLSDGTRNVLPADLAAGADDVPAPGLPGGDDDPGPRPRTDEEWSASMRHRPVPGLGKEWTYGLPSEYSGDAILWRDRTTRAGGARQAWRGKGWEPTGRFATVGIGPSQPSRLKALLYAAEKFEAKRRAETSAGPDVALPGLPGWRLRQTLAQKDRRVWQVVAPDGAAAGTVAPGWSGRHWSAQAGDPGREFHHGIPVTPWEPGLRAGEDGQEWKTRDAAAYGIAAEHDEAVPAPSEALARAAAARQRQKEDRAVGRQ